VKYSVIRRLDVSAPVKGRSPSWWALASDILILVSVVRRSLQKHYS
jgi:hypothetical protein